MVRRIVLAVLVVAALALLTISFRSPTSGALHDMQGYGSTALKPFQIAAERVARPFRDVYGYFSGLASAKSENAKLRVDVRHWRQIANSNLVGAQRTAELEKLIQLEQGATYPKDYRTVNTTVLSWASGASAQQVTIAAGSSSGIRIGTPIVTADGLLGHVTNVFPDTAQVMLLTDPDSSIPARDVNHGVAGIIRHGQGNTLILDRVSKAATVQKGDIIVTQGTVNPRYPDLYPYGIQIGSVLSANATDIASYYTVQVTPFSRLDSLDAVAALISTKRR
jgi:rod shape-determining protein MreC